MNQKEASFNRSLTAPRFVPKSVIDTFKTYRDAVVWTWENRCNVGVGEQADQSLCANQIGLHTPQMSRCVNRHSRSPMNLCPDYIPGFQAFCGWYAISQFLATQEQMTLMEQVLEERKAAA